MHSPSVSQELAKNVRADGDISMQEFGKLILHWFPGAWMLFSTLKRQVIPGSKPGKRDEDDTASPSRLLNALRDILVGPQTQPTLESRIVRVSVSDMIGEQALEQVYEVMASDAMHQCAEETFDARLYLEDEETLAFVPEGLVSLPLQLPSVSLIQDRFHLAFERIRIVLADMENSGCGFGRLDCKRSPLGREELVKLMAIRSYRLRLEREYGVELAYQWPGIIASAQRNATEQLEMFRSFGEQVLAIHKAAV